MSQYKPKHSVKSIVHRKWRLKVPSLIPVVCALVGMALLLYPSIASWFSQLNQSKVIAEYTQAAQHVHPDAQTQIARAHRYNDSLNSGAVYKAMSNVPSSEGASTDPNLKYDDLLNVNGAGLMGRLKIPSIDLDLPIYHGTSDETLERGLGHLEGTSLPVGGIGTRTVITGHRGLANALMFTNLDKVKQGDTFTFEILDQVLTYRVNDIRVVEPDQTESLHVDPNKDLATLVTCTPLGVNSHRILLTGERVNPTPAQDVQDAGKAPSIPGFPYWALIVLAGLCAIGIYIWRIGYQS